MFEKNKCPRCEFFVKQSWNFCPHCGTNLKIAEPTPPQPMPLMMGSVIDLNVNDIFKDVNEMLKGMLGEEPFKGSISITKLGGPSGPKIQVKTSGDYKKVEPEINKRLGVKKKISLGGKATAEPEINVKEMPHETLIEIELPGVKHSENIEIHQLEQSIEVRAASRDKVYFKLIPISENSQIIEKTLNKGTLKIRLKK